MLACPFKIPKFEWQTPIPVITKCTMCYNRIKNGKSPACVSVCPEGVMKFGERDVLLREAKAIIENDNRYIKHIYGENEAGGTNWLYISDTPFEKLGFNINIVKKPLPQYTSLYMKCTPIFGAIWVILLTFLYFITKPKKITKNNNPENLTQSKNNNPKINNKEIKNE
jgi:formate dehydrogenase iron-sulfur subunit